MNDYKILILKAQDKYKNNIYIVYDEITKDAFIVDPSCDITIINSTIRQYGLNLKYVLITHAHIDHVRTVNDIIYDYDTVVYISKKECTFYKFFCKNLICINENSKISFGNNEILCIETPGHTYGSVCYQLDNMLFTGDTVFIEGCGECIGQGASAQKMYFSIEKLKSIISDATHIYPGHTYYTQPGETMEFVKDNNMYFMFDNINDFISFRTRTNQKGLYEFI